MGSEMPVETVFLRDVTTKIGSGATPTGGKESYKTQGISLIRSQNVYNHGFEFAGLAFIDDLQARKLSNVTLEPGDVLVNITGDSIARSCMVPDTVLPARVNQHVAIVRANRDHLFPRYLRFVTIAPEIQSTMFALASSGATRDALTKEMLEMLVIPLPDLEKQKSTAQILGTLDDKIELLRQMNETLEAMARALFKSWFVDFDPVRKKADGLPTGMPKEIEDLFPSGFEDSELGEIPKGWRLTTVGELSERVAMGPFGSNILVSTFVESGVPVISGKHLGGIFVEDSDFKFLTPEHSLSLSGSVVRRGDIVLTHAGTIGQISLVPSKSQYDFYNISQRQFFVRPMQGTHTTNFLTLFFQSENGQHLLLANASQVGVPSISRPVSYLRTVQLVLPSTNVLGHFQEFTDSVFEQMQANSHEVRVLSGIRDSLLPKLISGDLELTDEMISQILEPAK